jgi:hypothetical protein
MCRSSPVSPITDGIRPASRWRPASEVWSLTWRATAASSGWVQAGWSLQRSPASREASSMKQAPVRGLRCLPGERIGSRSGGWVSWRDMRAPKQIRACTRQVCAVADHRASPTWRCGTWRLAASELRSHWAAEGELHGRPPPRRNPACSASSTLRSRSGRGRPDETRTTCPAHGLTLSGRLLGCLPGACSSRSW